MKIFVPTDTTACALGADLVAAALQRWTEQQSSDVQLIRNGSRGVFWLEPLVEIKTPRGRVAFANVEPADVPELLLSDGTPNQNHPRYVGLVTDIPWLNRQQRLTFARAGVIDPLSVGDYIAHGGFVGLCRALTMKSQDIVAEIAASGLRGRGGAAFPAGIKWKTVHDAPAIQKYIVCNADEGDSGTFADRLLMEADPLQLIEGMVIAGLAVGADKGYIYLRSEYPRALTVLNAAIEHAMAAGYLGDDILGSGRRFFLQVRLGAGAYICGEETALLDSLEGKRGMVRAKPPLPALKGLFGQPSVVNNVLTFAAATTILAKGPHEYQDFGMGRSRGTLPFQLAGNIRRGGIVELPFGMTLRQLVEEFGGGTASGRPIRAIQVGGPLGAYLPEAQWDTPLDYEAFAAIGAMLGHGGIVVFDDSVDMGEQARFAMEFCSVESCGKCTPCRIGSTRGVEVIDRIRRGEQAERNLQLLTDLCDTMVDGSLCAMGGMTPYPVRSVLKYFRDDLLGTTRPSDRTISQAS